MLLAGACSAGDGECTFAGDPALAMEVEAGFRAADGAFVPLDDGAAIDLIVPSQGGECLFPAPRARNLCGKDVRIEATIADGEGNALGPFAVNTTMIERDGWLVPDMATNSSAVPNVCACPNGWTDAVAGTPLALDLRVIDRDEQREGGVALTVIPTCDAIVDDAARDRCACECGPGPVGLGDCT